MAKVTEPLRHALYKVSLLTNSNTLTHPFSAYQLRNFANAVKNSPTILLPEWRKTIKQLATDADDPKKALADRIMPHDVATHWNSTYDMLKFAKSYQDPINQMTDSRSLKLRYCMITESEWELVKQLRDILKTVTLQFSTDTPCLASVIPAIDKMHDELTKASKKKDNSPALRAALVMGKGLLNKYYSLTDESEVYRIAMGSSSISFTSATL
ncbi:hypothetical protein BGW80DRAFT_1174487 [Lactifluus volemus]|nr:hypothetical protein BGW80DRAFT_1174487 [Lactifluus volemus]